MTEQPAASTPASAYEWTQGPDYAPALRAELMALEAELPGLHQYFGRVHSAHLRHRVKSNAECVRALEACHMAEDAISALRTRIAAAQSEASDG